MDFPFAFLLGKLIVTSVLVFGKAVVQWSSALVCEPRIPGSNPRYMLTIFHSLLSPPSGQRIPKLLPYCPQTGLTTLICV